MENLNSRLRGYFFLRRHLGEGYLSLLQFFLNHRRMMRSECPQHAQRSAAETLTGQPLPHWFNMPATNQKDQWSTILGHSPDVADGR